jgi:hypothetical protein
LIDSKGNIVVTAPLSLQSFERNMVNDNTAAAVTGTRPDLGDSRLGL